MRSTIIFLALACGPAFCQEYTALPATLQPTKTLMVKPAIGVCSIPLINVLPAGKPVAMPNVLPLRNPAPVSPSNNPTDIDHMSIVAPAPACPADFGKVQAPPAAPPAKPSSAP